MPTRPVDNRIPKLPRRTLAYTAFCFAGVLIFFIAGLLPNQHKIFLLDKDIERLHQDMKKQTMLIPVFQKVHQSMQGREKQALAFPKKEEYPIARLGDLPVILQSLAGESEMIFHSAIPDVNMLRNGLGRLRMHLSLGGDFIRFHDFLIHLGKLAYLDQIEAITISTENGVGKFGLQVLFWIEK